MKFLMKYVEEKNGRIYINLYAPDHLNCKAHKAIQTFKSSMFDVMGFDDSYTHEMKPTYYVVHGLIEQYDWIDLELGMTNEFRDFVIKNATNAELLNAEGVKYDRMNGVIKKLIDRHERIIKNNPPLRMGIISMKEHPKVFIIYNLDDNAKYHVVEVITTKSDIYLEQFESYFERIAKSFKGKKCVVKLIKNSSAAVAFADMPPSIYSNYSQEFFDEDDPDLRKILEYNTRIEKIQFVQFKTLRNIAIVSNYRKDGK